jgi:hypothetical protein
MFSETADAIEEVPASVFEMVSPRNELCTVDAVAVPNIQKVLTLSFLATLP